MPREIRTQDGVIVLTEELVAALVARIALDCPGVVGLAARGIGDGLAGVLGIDRPDRGVEVALDPTSLSIRVHVTVSYGVSIPVVAQQVRSAIRSGVEAASGIRANRVDVRVEGIRAVDGA